MHFSFKIISWNNITHFFSWFYHHYFNRKDYMHGQYGTFLIPYGAYFFFKNVVLKPYKLTNHPSSFPSKQEREFNCNKNEFTSNQNLIHLCSKPLRIWICWEAKFDDNKENSTHEFWFSWIFQFSKYLGVDGITFFSQQTNTPCKIDVLVALYQKSVFRIPFM